MTALNLLQSISSVTTAMAVDRGVARLVAPGAAPEVTASAMPQQLAEGPYAVPLACTSAVMGYTCEPAVVVVPSLQAAPGALAECLTAAPARAASALSSGLEILAEASQADDLGTGSERTAAVPASAARPSLVESAMASSQSASSSGSLWSETGTDHANGVLIEHACNPSLLSPSTLLCSLLSSPDLNQLMSPNMLAQMTTSTAWVARSTECPNGASAPGSVVAGMMPPPAAQPSALSQFKRRQNKSALASASTMAI